MRCPGAKERGEKEEEGSLELSATQIRALLRKVFLLSSSSSPSPLYLLAKEKTGERESTGPILVYGFVCMSERREKKKGEKEIFDFEETQMKFKAFYLNLRC